MLKSGCCDERGRITYLNGSRRIAFTGPDHGTGYGGALDYTYVHPDDAGERMLKHPLQEALGKHPFSQEFAVCVEADRVYRWMFDVAYSAIERSDGSFGGFIGSAIDTTDQKLAQQALAKVNVASTDRSPGEGRSPHNEESARRIICQPVGATTFDGSGQLTKSPLRWLACRDKTKSLTEYPETLLPEIASDVQTLPHQLHSSTL